jgi:hypothetical protein
MLPVIGTELELLADTSREPERAALPSGFRFGSLLDVLPVNDGGTPYPGSFAAFVNAAGAVISSTEMASMHYVRQDAPKGLGHAVLCAAEHVGQEAFAVLLGDDLIDPGDPLLRRMIEVRQQRGGSVVALMEVEPDQVSSYGVVAMKPTSEDDVVEITDMVEKPSPAQAPSNWIIIGRYVRPGGSACCARPSPAGAGDPAHRRAAGAATAAPARTAAACMACCSAAAGSTPGTRSLPAHADPVRLRAAGPGL